MAIQGARRTLRPACRSWRRHGRCPVCRRRPSRPSARECTARECPASTRRTRGAWVPAPVCSAPCLAWVRCCAYVRVAAGVRNRASTLAARGVSRVGTRGAGNRNALRVAPTPARQPTSYDCEGSAVMGDDRTASVPAPAPSTAPTAHIDFPRFECAARGKAAMRSCGGSSPDRSADQRASSWRHPGAPPRLSEWHRGP